MSQNRGAVVEISRGLSGATPPVRRPQFPCTLEGCEEICNGSGIWHPSRMHFILRMVPGVSRGTLNPRLISGNPPVWLKNGGLDRIIYQVLPARNWWPLPASGMAHVANRKSPPTPSFDFMPWPDYLPTPLIFRNSPSWWAQQFPPRP